MKELTKAEEQIMNVLWELERAFVKDIVERFPDPKPAYNTVSTIVRIMERKGFVGHESFGKTHQYFPRITKEQYTKEFLRGFVKTYFNNSFENFVSFFVRDESINVGELEDVLHALREEIRKQKDKDHE